MVGFGYRAKHMSTAGKFLALLPVVAVVLAVVTYFGHVGPVGAAETDEPEVAAAATEDAAAADASATEAAAKDAADVATEDAAEAADPAAEDAPAADVEDPAAPSDADEKTEVNEPLSPVVVDQNDNIQPLRIVQQLPEYPGGWTTFMQWLTKNLKYPPAAQRQKVEGQVVVTFVVNRDGTLSNIRIAKSAGALLDQEALRVAHLMPKWKPGIDKGEPCRTLMAIPIIFKL